MRNRDLKLIDLGALARDANGAWGYRLDGNQQAGSGFFTVESALQDIVEHLRFLWLDGQFTAVADASPQANLDGAGPARASLGDRMKTVLLAAAAASCLVTASAAGGLAPVVEPAVIEAETAASSQQFVILLMLLVLIAAAVSSADGGVTG